MKLSNARLVRDASGLSNLSQKSLPIKVSYAIAKNITKIEAELKVYDREREKIIEKYSIKDKDGKTIVGENGVITIEDKFLERWNHEVKELQEIEVEIEIHKFNIAVLENGNYDMTPAEIALIDYMIED